MSRILKALLFLCLAAVFTAAASPKKNPDVEREVKAELVKETFTTKILVGSYIPCPLNVNTSGRNGAIKPVDTELSLDGSIKYYARANCFYQTNPGVIALGVIFDPTRFYVTGVPTGQIAPGTSVRVLSVDFKEDRVEVNISWNSNVYGGGSGKIKYMLGASYRTLSTDELMEAINLGIRIPAYEKLDQLKTEFETLRVNFEQAENKYNLPGGTAASKLANAIALKLVLEQIQKNRTEFAATGKSDPQAEVYSEKLSALAPDIARLTEAAHMERVAAVQNQLQAQLQQLSAIQTQVRQKPPSSLAEWQERSDILARYSTLLDDRQRLLDRLQNENGLLPPDDVKYMNDSRAEIDTDRKALELGHRQLQLADLTAQYLQLTKERKQLLDGYSLAFGTAREKIALQDLIAVLDRMVANRDQAAGFGDKAAITQLVQCRAEAEKYKKR